MNLDNFLDKKFVKKVVDQEPPSIPGPDNRSITQLPATIQTSISQTPLTTLANDLSVEAAKVVTNASSVITQIVNSNNLDPIYINYVNVAQAAYNNMDISIGPAPIDQNLLQTLQRDSYRRLTDPRAPYLEDLLNIQGDALSFKYVLDNVWATLQDVNPLDDRLIRISFNRTNDYLQLLNSNINNIGKANTLPITEALIKGVCGSVMGLILNHPTANVGSSITNTVSTLRNIKAFLQAQVIIQNTNWEDFQNTIKKFVGNLGKLTAQRLITASAYRASFKFQTDTFSFLNTLRNQLGVLTPYEIADITEFSDQINNSILNEMKKVEDHMINQESLILQTERTRELSLANSQKTTKTKQYIYLLDAAIVYLNSANAVNLNSRTYLVSWLNSMQNQLFKNATNYYNKTSVADPDSNLLLNLQAIQNYA